VQFGGMFLGPMMLLMESILPWENVIILLLLCGICSCCCGSDISITCFCRFISRFACLCFSANI